MNVDIAQDANISQSKIANLAETLDTKVDKVEGKTLTSNDFTDEYKATKFAYIAYLLKNLDMNVTRGKDPSEALLAMLVNEKK